TTSSHNSFSCPSSPPPHSNQHSFPTRRSSDMWKKMRERLITLLETYEKHILGQSMNLKLLLASILAGGHVLLEGVPGTGKTKMVRTLANLLGGTFNRIQFTPDLLPSDITGSTIYNMKESYFQTIKGPIFAN